MISFVKIQKIYSDDILPLIHDLWLIIKFYWNNFTIKKSRYGHLLILKYHRQTSDQPLKLNEPGGSFFICYYEDIGETDSTLIRKMYINTGQLWRSFTRHNFSITDEVPTWLYWHKRSLFLPRGTYWWPGQ